MLVVAVNDATIKQLVRHVSVLVHGHPVVIGYAYKYKRDGLPFALEQFGDGVGFIVSLDFMP